MVSNRFDKFEEDFRELKSDSKEILKLLQHEREERIKNTKDIEKLDKQMNINNGDVCLKTRIANVENTVERHSRYFWGVSMLGMFAGWFISNFKK